MGSQAEMPMPWQLLSLFRLTSGDSTGLRSSRPPPVLLLPALVIWVGVEVGVDLEVVVGYVEAEVEVVEVG